MASQTTLFTNETFTAPAGESFDGLIASSSSVNATSGDTGARLVVQYHAFNPDGKDVVVGFNVQAILEREVAPGIWVPAAVDFSPDKGTDDAENQIIELTTDLNLNPGTPNRDFIGSKEVVELSHTQGEITGKARLCIFANVTDASKPQLTSLTLSAYLERF